MFDKLKRKFIFMNMALLSSVFLCILGTIYISTAIHMNRDISQDLYKEINEEATINIDGNIKDLKNNIKSNKDKLKMHNSIRVTLDNDNNIIYSFSQNNTENSNLQELVDAAIAQDTTSGQIQVDNIKYSYLKKVNPDNMDIVFIDRSNYRTVMNQLFETLTVVGILSVLILLVISIYLTNKFILPIKDAFEKQKRFIADASHELRTPLTIIDTNTSLILSNPDDTIRNQSRWIHYITSQTSRMSGLINEMLSLAKLDIDEDVNNFVTINLDKIIDSMTLEFEAVIFENGLSLETNISKNITILGDNNNIKKLFSILMDNAIKHSNKNGTITVELTSIKNKVRLKISNTGKGIPSEHLDKIFERFYRVDNSRVRETGGYGLGLSIAKSIVDRHKGNIYAQSNLGVDTSFIVEFPQ